MYAIGLIIYEMVTRDPEYFENKRIRLFKMYDDKKRKAIMEIVL